MGFGIKAQRLLDAGNRWK